MSSCRKLGPWINLEYSGVFHVRFYLCYKWCEKAYVCIQEIIFRHPWYVKHKLVLFVSELWRPDWVAFSQPTEWKLLFLQQQEKVSAGCSMLETGYLFWGVFGLIQEIQFLHFQSTNSAWIDLNGTSMVRGSVPLNPGCDDKNKG